MILQGSAVTLGFHMGGALVMELEEEEVAVVINSCVCITNSCMLQVHILFASHVSLVLLSINLQPQTSVFWV